MTNFMVIVVLAIVIGAAIAYIVKEKKKGVRCVGCPYGGTCGKQGTDDCCSCHTETNE